MAAIFALASLFLLSASLVAIRELQSNQVSNNDQDTGLLNQIFAPSAQYDKFVVKLSETFSGSHGKVTSETKSLTIEASDDKRQHPDESQPSLQVVNEPSVGGPGVVDEKPDCDDEVDDVKNDDDEILVIDNREPGKEFNIFQKLLNGIKKYEGDVNKGATGHMVFNSFDDNDNDDDDDDDDQGIVVNYHPTAKMIAELLPILAQA